MKAKISCWFSMMLIITIVQGQGLMLVGGNTIVTFSLQNTEPQITEIFVIKNTTLTTQKIRVKRIFEELTTGHQPFFCFDLCYPPERTFTDGYIEIDPDSTLDRFHAGIIHNNQSGTSIVKYELWSENSNEKLTLTVKFVILPATNSDNKLNPNKLNLNLYPNPCLDVLHINYSSQIEKQPLFLKIVDVLGKQVAEHPLLNNTNELLLDVRDWKRGIYFYSLQVENSIIHRAKLLVE